MGIGNKSICWIIFSILMNNLLTISSGKTWRSKITVPREFQFHKREEPQGPYQRVNSQSKLNISTEERIQKNVLFLERGRTISPQGGRYNQVIRFQI